MIALPEQLPAAGRQRMLDTGVTFDGRVRVWLICEVRADAEALGAKLHEMGLPQTPVRRLRPEGRWKYAINTNVPPVPVRQMGMTGTAKVPLMYRKCPIVLETDKESDLNRFFKWLHGKNPNHKAPAPKDRMSLNQLADDGEIDTIDAG